jgi:hypothetical protein
MTVDKGKSINDEADLNKSAFAMPSEIAEMIDMYES